LNLNQFQGFMGLKKSGRESCLQFCMEQKKMNMISTGTFLNEMEASDKQNNLLVKKLVGAWEQKNSKTARAGGVSLMALSLAACGSSDDTSDTVSYTQLQYDNAKTVASSTALTDAGSTTHATVDAAITSNDASITSAATTAATTTALTDAGSTTHATVDAAITSNDASIASAATTTALTDSGSTAHATVDAAITSNDASAISLSYRDAAATLGVTGTSTMTNAELITAIKTANDSAIAAGVDLTSNDTAAINAAVAADTAFNNLAELIAAYNDAANPPTLTTGRDILTGDGTNQNFNAGTANTLNATDSITDSSTTDSDSLTANIGGSLGLNLTNVEELVFNVTATSTLDFTDVSGTTSISNTANTAGADLVLDNLGSVPTVSISSNDDDTTINFTNAALASASDSLTVNLSSMTGASNVIVTSDAGTNTLETLTVNSNGVPNTVSDIQTTSAGVTTLNIAGTKDLTISTALDNEVVTVAITNTGATTLLVGTGTVSVTGSSGAEDVTGGTGANTISLGAGDDTIQFAANNLTSADTVAGGDGADSITFTTGNETIVLADFTNVTSVETITAAANIGIAGNIGALAAAAGVNTVTFADGGNNDSLTVDAEFTMHLQLT
jgi:hypothetical protein